MSAAFPPYQSRYGLGKIIQKNTTSVEPVKFHGGFVLGDIIWVPSHFCSAKDDRSDRLVSHRTKRHANACLFVLVGEAGFEPAKSVTTDLQSAPFGRSGIPPDRYLVKWSWWTDSNPRPADYKSAALPTELHQHTRFSVLPLSAAQPVL